MTPPKGPNTLVIGNNGSASVMATYEIQRAGLQMAHCHGAGGFAS
jgi:acyl-CoA synthetase (NDP forming)